MLYDRIRRSAFFRHLATVGATRALSLGLSLVTLPFLLRVLGVAGFGHWTYIFTIANICVFIVTAGLPTFAAREIAERPAGARTLVSDVFSLRLTLGVGVAIILAVIAVLIEPPGLTRNLILLYACPIQVLVAANFDFVLAGHERFHEAAAQELATTIIYSAGIFLLVRTPADVPLVAASAGAAAVSGALYSNWRRVALGYPLSPSWRPAAWWEMVRVSMFYGGVALLTQTSARVGHLVIRALMGEFALGVYAAAMRLVEIAAGFVGIIHAILLPKLARNAAADRELRRITRLSVALIMTTALPLAVATILLSPVVVPWILGPSYAPSVDPLRWLAPALVFQSLAAFFTTTVLYGLRLHRRAFYATFAGALVAFALTLMLVPKLGLPGAAIALVISQTVVWTIAYAAIHVRVGRPLATPAVGASIIAAAFMAAILAGGVRMDLHPLTLFVAGALAYATPSWLLTKKAVEHELALMRP